MGKNAIVLYDFNAEVDSEVSVLAGDRIVVMIDNNDGWSTIKHVATGRTGYIPTQYFEYTDELDLEESPEIAQTPIPVPKEPDSSATTLTEAPEKSIKKILSKVDLNFSLKKEDNKRLSTRPQISGPKTVTVTSNAVALPPSEEGTTSITTTEGIPPEAEPEPVKIRGKKDSRSPRAAPKINKNDAGKLLRENLKIYLLRKRLNTYTNEKEFRDAKTKNELIRETVATERSYVNSLKVFVNVFLEPLKKLGLLNEQKQKAIFSNVVQILSVNQILLDDLEAELEKWPNSKISVCFKKMAPFLIIYTTYVNNYDNAFNLLTAEQKSNSKFRDFLSEAQKDPQTERHPITSFLIMPVQRIPRYKMLLADILKNLPDDHVEKQDMKDALEKISNIAVGVNESKRHNENSQTLVQLSQTLKNLKNGSYATLVQPNRSLIREGVMKVRCNAKDFTIDEYRATLCSDVLILLQQNSKIKDKKKACYYIFFTFCKMHPSSEETYDFSLEVINDGQILTYSLFFNDLEEKNSWIHDIEECIETQNKANQLKLGDKYQGFITQGTIRSQTSSEVKQATVLFQNIAKEYAATEKKLANLDHSLRSNELMLKKLQETIKAQKEELARTEENMAKMEEQQIEVNQQLSKKLAIVKEHDAVFLEALKEETEAFRVIFGELPTDQSVVESTLNSTTPRRREKRTSGSYDMSETNIDDYRKSISGLPPVSSPKPLPNTKPPPVPPSRPILKEPPPIPGNKPVLKEAPNLPVKPLGTIPPPPKPGDTKNKPPLSPRGSSDGDLQSKANLKASVTRTSSDSVDDKPKPAWKQEIVNKTNGTHDSSVSKPLPQPKKLPQVPPTPPPKKQLEHEPLTPKGLPPTVDRNSKPVFTLPTPKDGTPVNQFGLRKVVRDDKK